MAQESGAAPSAAGPVQDGDAPANGDSDAAFGLLFGALSNAVATMAHRNAVVAELDALQSHGDGDEVEDEEEVNPNILRLRAVRAFKQEGATRYARHGAPTAALKFGLRLLYMQAAAQLSDEVVVSQICFCGARCAT